MTSFTSQLNIWGMPGSRRSTTPKEFRDGVIRRTREAREAAHMDRKDVADALEITVENYKKFETRSAIALHLLIPFCRLTGADPYELLTGEPFRIGREAKPKSVPAPFLSRRKVAT
jgi:hypothetical protein